MLESAIEINSDNVLCLKPIQIRPKSYGTHEWFPDNSTKIETDNFILVPCGRCIVCKYKLAREWSFRIQLEMDYYGGPESCAFVTLTYNDEHLPEDRSVFKEEIQLYLKRLRERLKGRDIKYYAIGDYGELEKRAHYHLIIMNVDGADRADNLGRLKRKEAIIRTNDDWYHMHMAWGKGYTDIQRPRSTGGVGGYVANYLSKQSKAIEAAEKMGLAPPFRMMSKQLGLRSVVLLATKFREDSNVKWPINYIEKVGTDGKIYKHSLGRYLRKKLHEVAGKMGIYIAHKQLYIKRQYYKQGTMGVNSMELAHKLSKYDQEQVEIKEAKAKFKLKGT